MHAANQSEMTRKQPMAKLFLGLSGVSFAATVLPCFLRMSSSEAVMVGVAGFGTSSGSVFIGGLIGGFAALLVNTSRLNDRAKNAAITSLGAALYLLGYVAMIALRSHVKFEVAGFVFGIGVAFLSIGWLLCLEVRDFRQTLAQTALVVVCAVVVVQALCLIPEGSRVVFSLVLLVVGMAEPIRSLWANRGSDPRQLVCRSDGNDDYDGLFSSRPSFAEVFKALSSSMIGLSIFAVYSNALQVPFPSVDVSGTSLGLGVASLLIFLATRFGKKKFAAPFIYWVLFPAIAAVLLILDSFPVNSQAFMVGAGGITVFFSGLGLFAVAFLLIANRQNQLSPYWSVGLSFIAFSFSGFIGCMLRESELSTDERGSLLLVLSTSYMVYLLFSPALQLWKMRKSSPVRTDGSVMGSDDIDGVCTRLARRYGLSRREEEVLAYVGQGYNSPYIAKMLFISDSTVRSHLKSIYRKTGVPSRMDLVDLIRRESAS